MVAAIHIVVSGRARFKVSGLYRSEALRQHLEDVLRRVDGIAAVSASSLTGNVLVIYNSGRYAADIAELIESALNEYGNGNRQGDAEARVRLAAERPKFRNSAPSKASNGTVPQSRRKLRRLVVNAENQPEEAWHLVESSVSVRVLQTSTAVGLRSAAVTERLKRFGPNVLPESVPRSGWSIFFGQFNSLPVALLGVAAGISVATGGIADAIVIAAVVAINAAIGYVTESGAERTINSLKHLVRPFATVLRDKRAVEINAEQVVPGDILILRPGMYVAADARVIDARHLSVDESALTGESMPVMKDPAPLAGEDLPVADRLNMVYMGTLVTGGQGMAVVVATGGFTEIGRIQCLVGEARAPETPMERQLDQMGGQLVTISGAACAVVFAMGLLRGYPFLQMLKTAISLAVAAVPEGLPTVATTTLALGIRNMRRHRVLIRHLEAVETLGSVQTICLDKTGTLTLNSMTVQEIYAGMVRFTVERTLICKDGTTVNPYEVDELLRLMHVTVLCSESEVALRDGEQVVTGSPTENALLHVAIASGVDVTALRTKFKLRTVLHRSEKRNVMITLHRTNGSPSEIAAVKGSPREVLALCQWYMKDGKKVPLTDDDRSEIEVANERMAAASLRILGVAHAFLEGGARQVADPHAPSGDDDLPFAGDQLVWLGMIGMADPLRDGVRELMGVFHQAGIETVMITGDQTPTAQAIGKELNLSGGEQLEILDSRQLASMPSEVLGALCKRVHVFARVSPAHKLQIVQALQGSGRTVAMTGDGINDGPALKVADIGVAMGHAGTDVAREVADVVLEDDNLQTMVVAISQGRTIYNNIRKSLHFLLATNMSEIMVTFGGIALGLGQPLTAMQLLWINLMSDIAPGIALALEPPEPDVLSQPPRDSNEPIVRREDYRRLAFEAGTLSAAAMGAYGMGVMRYGMGPRAGSLCFLSLTVGQLLHAISCRSTHHTIFDQHVLHPNRYLTAALAGSFALQGVALVLPGLRGLLGIGALGLFDGAVILGTATIPLLVNESTKKTLKGVEA